MSHLLCILLIYLLSVFPTRVSAFQGQRFLYYFFKSRSFYLLLSLVYSQSLEESLIPDRDSGRFAERMQARMDGREDGGVWPSIVSSSSEFCDASGEGALLCHRSTRMDSITTRNKPTQGQTRHAFTGCRTSQCCFLPALPCAFATSPGPPDTVYEKFFIFGFSSLF